MDFFQRDTFIQLLVPYLTWKDLPIFCRTCKVWNSSIQPYKDIIIQNLVNSGTIRDGYILPSGVLHGILSESQVGITWDKGLLSNFSIFLETIPNIGKFCHLLYVTPYVNKYKAKFSDNTIVVEYYCYRIMVTQRYFHYSLTIKHGSSIDIQIFYDWSYVYLVVIEINRNIYIARRETGMIFHLDRSNIPLYKPNLKKGWCSAITQTDIDVIQQYLPRINIGDD